ncbi:MAG TPA: DUF4832 domain-containing protein [Chitinophagales bacterium]|nr:DUF4832 domain-containing protein [Chitinophagales bacterium]
MKNKTIKLLIVLLWHSLSIGQTVNYTVSQDIIANPERGLQKYSITSNNYATTLGANNLSVATLEGWKNSSDKVTVVFRYFLLNAFLDSNINSIYINNIQEDFNNIRTAGLKTIIRFSYSNNQGTGAQQATKSQILTHIDQISPILDQHKDIILSHQAGFIGTWGEWYYTNSTEFGTEGNISTNQWNNRKEIVDAMLDATPANIPLQVRYAEIKENMYGSHPLTELTAYQNTANARVGFYNDAFLNNWGDQGTYSVSSKCQNPAGNSDYNYIANETKYLPMTGETNGLNSCNTGFRTTGANAITEMEATNWTTINRDYYTPFWNNLISTNHYEEILKRLGYRLSLLSSNLTVNNSEFELNLTIRNTGFARMIKHHDVYLVLKDTTTNTVTTSLLNTDIRTWEDTVSISQNFNLGLTGTFKLYLWIPDKNLNLQNNSDYSIQLANSNVWNASTGYNDLFQTIILSQTALPIELLNFNVTSIGNKYVKLDWQTASEMNNDFFTIERSNNGNHWNEIAVIDGAGNSSTVLNYTATDKNPLYGSSYYRLKQTDFDGNFQYSKIQNLNISSTKNSTVKIYPNPTDQQITIEGEKYELESFNIYNKLGQNVTSATQIIKYFEGGIRMDISKLNSGIYYLKTKNTVNILFKK